MSEPYQFFAHLAHRIYRLRLFFTRPITLGVRVLLVHEGQILLVKHTYHDGWLLPGGGVKRGETLDTAAIRETREETGLKVTSLRLHGMYTNFHEYKSDHIAVFAGEGFDPSTLRRDPWEIQAAQFFPLNALPADVRAGHQRRIEEMVKDVPTRYTVW